MSLYLKNQLRYSKQLMDFSCYIKEMCGIYGFVSHGNRHSDLRSNLVDVMMKKVEYRGSDGVGIYLQIDEEHEVHKSYFKPSQFKRLDEFKNMKRRIKLAHNVVFIVQSRLSTSGSFELKNQHPLIINDDLFFHNGIYLKNNLLKSFSSDSWSFYSDLEPTVDTDNFLQDLNSENSFVRVQPKLSSVTIGSNTGSMFMMNCVKKNLILFGSEPISKSIEKINLQNDEVKIIGSKKILLNNFMNSTLKIYELGKYLEKSNQEECINCGLSKKVLTHFHSDNELCNQCLQDSKKQNSKLPTNFSSGTLLNNLLKNKRVVVGFSGGRDSSYGLLRLNKIEGIEIIAVSYDWGGVTDLGRRNQSRVCGILGIEHVWISADLLQKRKNINKNLIAWCKRPSLVTLPLMLAGDKKMWVLPKKIAKKRNADYVIFCTSPLEKTEFKVSLAGIKPHHFSNRPNEIRLRDRLNLALKYGFELLKNPWLINTSLIDSVNGFMHYFFTGIKNLQFYDYEDWNEDLINLAIQSELSWEKSPYQASTWRIGDITTPFYNMVYYSTLGFTEFDTLRANQVRQGHLTKEQAKKYLIDDNKLSYHGLEEYAKTMGVSPLMLLRGMEKLVRRYNITTI
jgi:glucosamine--fructose-6-phosphate aminotransferase (isomerizing)